MHNPAGRSSSGTRACGWQMGQKSGSRPMTMLTERLWTIGGRSSSATRKSAFAFFAVMARTDDDQLKFADGLSVSKPARME